jgi:ubiquinone/menaquinone biosynthesis C-methylase UbiE
MAFSHTEKVSSLYNARSTTYDENKVHIAQCRDYISWANLKSGQSLLDLATGTGLVALGAKSVVGDKGYIVGIDISDGMLDIARQKAKSQNLDVKFLNHDISDLDDIKTSILPPGQEGFDVVTCAAALILLPDPQSAIKHWLSLLRPGGRFVTDVQTHDANLVMNVLSAIAAELGMTVPWHSELYRSIDSLSELVKGAGYEIEKVFETEAYATTSFDVGKADDLFETVVEKDMYAEFGRNEVRGRAKDLFVKEMQRVSGAKEEIVEETKYWVVIARRPF